MTPNRARPFRDASSEKHDYFVTPALTPRARRRRQPSALQVEVTFQHPTQPASLLPVTEALQRVPQHSSDPSGSEALVYDLNLPNGMSLMACLYIVYSVPLAQHVDPSTSEVVYTWLKVTRDKCSKGCCGPVMAAIQRLGRQGRMQGVPTPEGAVPLCGGNESKMAPQRAGAAPCSPGSAAALDRAGPVFRDRWKNTRHLFVSVDEASSHVEPGPGGSRLFRRVLTALLRRDLSVSRATSPRARRVQPLLFGYFGSRSRHQCLTPVRAAGGFQRLRSIPMPFGRLLMSVHDPTTREMLGTTLSGPIRALANNDVPKGAAAIEMKVLLPGADAAASTLTPSDGDSPC